VVSPQPVIEHCVLKCSGDDAVNISGAAAPTFRDCELIGRKCAVKVMGGGRGEFVDCKLNTCQHQVGISYAYAYGKPFSLLRDQWDSIFCKYSP
jgi:hypothetical protein